MQHLDTTSSVNFGFLAEHDELFIQLAAAAERAFSSDPNTTLIKLRQLREALAQHLAVLSGIKFDVQTTQADLFYKLGSKLKVKPFTHELFTLCVLRAIRPFSMWNVRHVNSSTYF